MRPDPVAQAAAVCAALAATPQLTAAEAAQQDQLRLRLQRARAFPCQAVAAGDKPACTVAPSKLQAGHPQPSAHARKLQYSE